MVGLSGDKLTTDFLRGPDIIYSADSLLVRLSLAIGSYRQANLRRCLSTQGIPGPTSSVTYGFLLTTDFTKQMPFRAGQPLPLAEANPVGRPFLHTADWQVRCPGTIEDHVHVF